MYSFAVMAVALLRLFAALWNVKDPARIFAFLAGGVVLLSLSLAYHRLADALRDDDRP